MSQLFAGNRRVGDVWFLTLIREQECWVPTDLREQFGSSLVLQMDIIESVVNKYSRMFPFG